VGSAVTWGNRLLEVFRHIRLYQHTPYELASELRVTPVYIPWLFGRGRIHCWQELCVVGLLVADHHVRLLALQVYFEAAFQAPSDANILRLCRLAPLSSSLAPSPPMIGPWPWDDQDQVSFSLKLGAAQPHAQPDQVRGNGRVLLRPGVCCCTVLAFVHAGAPHSTTSASSSFHSRAGALSLCPMPNLQWALPLHAPKAARANGSVHLPKHAAAEVSTHDVHSYMQALYLLLNTARDRGHGCPFYTRVSNPPYHKNLHIWVGVEQ